MANLFTTRRKELFSLKKLRKEKITGIIEDEDASSEMICNSCKNVYGIALLEKKYDVCPNCGYHMQVSAKKRIEQLADEGSFEEQYVSYHTGNPLRFPGYRTKIKQLEMTNGNKDAIITGTAKINGTKVELAVMDSTFMMGSMGTVLGEKFTLAVEYAMKNKLPLVAVCASGGARMQEGMFSLMQMAKTSAVISKFSENGGFFLSVLTHPTMGGVSASFAMLGDIILAEPGALIGFAGPRVIEQTINEKLPKGFQRAEFQEEHGMVDKIVSREELKNTIGKLVAMHNVI